MANLMLSGYLCLRQLYYLIKDAPYAALHYLFVYLSKTLD